MVDPFGITAGVIGVAIAALDSARRLKELIDGIQGAPEAVRALSEDLHALQDVLEALRNLLDDTRFTGGRGRAEAMPALEPHLKNCTVTLNSLFLAIKRHTKTSGDPKKSKWSGFIWYWRDKEVLTLQNRLTTYKMSLDLAVSVANLTSSSTGFSEIRKSIRGMRKRVEEDCESVEDSSFMGSSLAGTDYGYAMKQWLRETESIMGDYSPCIMPDTGSSEVITHLSRQSSGAPSDPSSSYSTIDENLSLISSTVLKEETSAGGCSRIYTPLTEGSLPSCTMDGLCSTAFSRSHEHQARPTLIQMRMSGSNGSIQGGNVNARPDVWPSSVTNVAATTDDREKKRQEGEAPALVSKFEVAELPGSPAVQSDHSGRTETETKDGRNPADIASLGTEIFNELVPGEGHRTNQERRSLRLLTAAQSLAQPASSSFAAGLQAVPVGSTNSNPHKSISAFFETTTLENNQTTSSHLANILELRRPLGKRDPFASLTIVDKADITEDDGHEFARPGGQNASFDSGRKRSTESSPPQKTQSPPASRVQWHDARHVDYEGNDYVDDGSGHLKPPPAPAPSLSLELLARRDVVLVPNFVKDCIWMLDTHGLHLPEAFGDGEVSDELNQLRHLLGADVPLELGLVMDLNWVHPTPEQLIKIRALLRYFFKSLTEPLFTRAFYDTVVAAAAPAPVYTQYHILRDFIPRLVPAHFETAKHLVTHLQRVCQQRSVQRMGNKKLASTWANILLPHNLFPTPDEREHQELLLQTMISHADTLFRDELQAGATHSRR